MQTYEQLEKELAEWAGYKPSQFVVCNSGTAALHLALEALQLPLTSVVLVPDFAFIAVARAVTLAGHIPVFIGPDANLNMDPIATLNVAVSIEPKAIIVVHTYGRAVHMAAFRQIAASYKLALIEDMAEAHGVRPDLFSTAATWSFYRNKIVCGEEGGAVAFADPAHADLARQLRSQGFTKDHNFYHVPRGHNYRLANLLARQILSSLREVEDNLRERRHIETLYDLACPAEWRQPPRQAPWVYDIRLPGINEAMQDSIIDSLQKADIAARHAFKPLHCQEEYKKCLAVDGDATEAAAREVIYLPIITSSTEPDDIKLAFQIIEANAR